MNCVIYARYSSEKQNEKSIEDQIDACKKFAEDNGFILVDTYVDKALSGKTDKRPGFQRMIEDSKTKRFKIILCWKFDRISRNTRDYYYYEKILYDNGVSIVSINEQIDDPQAAPIIKAVNLGMAESFNVTLAINVNRGLRSNAKKCLSNGCLPIGYVADKKGVINIDEKVAPYIKEIYSLFLSGWSYTDIARHLNLEGVKTRNNRKFKGHGVKRILTNPTYTGIYKYQDIVIDDGIPAIIDKADFLKVQERVKNYTRPHNNKEREERYFLKHKLYCFKCNNPMDICCGTSKNGVLYRYYKCECKTIRKDYIEPLVVELTKKYILTDKSIDMIADFVMGLQQDLKENSKAASIKIELKDVQKKIDKILNLFLDGLDSQAMRDKLKALENEAKDLKLRLALEESYNEDISRDAIIWYLNKFKNMDTDDKELTEQLIRELVQYVYLDDDHIWIQYNYAEKNKNTQALNLKELECSTNSHLVNPTDVHSNISLSNDHNYILLKVKMQVEISKISKNFFH